MTDSADTSARMRLPDGRTLGFAVFGDSSGRETIFHCHGGLSSRFEGHWLSEDARELGVRLITVDRPGIGLSDHLPGRRILDWPRDLAALADHLDLNTFAVLGCSGGAPYALATALALPDRVERVVTLSGLGPLARPEVMEILRLPQRILYRHLVARPLLARAPLAFLAGIAGLAPRRSRMARMEAVAGSIGGLARADRRVFALPRVQRARDLYPEHAHAAPFVGGARGAAWDSYLFTQPWGFELEDIVAPVALYHGMDDRICPPAMGRHLSERLPHAEAHFLPDEGHFSILLSRGADVLAKKSKESKPFAHRAHSVD